MLNINTLRKGDWVQNTRTQQRATFVNEQNGVWDNVMLVPPGRKGTDRVSDWCIVRIQNRVPVSDAFSVFAVWSVMEMELVPDLEQLALVGIENARVVP